MLGAPTPPHATTAPTATQRDLAANALVLGFAGAMWFGWAQEQPPAAWTTALAAGGAVGLLLAAAAGVATWRRRHGASAVHEPGAEHTYRRVVGVEVAAIALGVVVLAVAGLSAYLAAWILFVVGAHFVPLGRIFRIPGPGVVAGLLVAVSAAAVVVGMSGAVLPSAVAGGGGGLVLVVAGAMSLWRSRHPGSTAREA